MSEHKKGAKLTLFYPAAALKAVLLLESLFYVKSFVRFYINFPL